MTAAPGPHAVTTANQQSMVGQPCEEVKDAVTDELKTTSVPSF